MLSLSAVKQKPTVEDHLDRQVNVKLTDHSAARVALAGLPVHIGGADHFLSAARTRYGSHGRLHAEERP